jgi:phospholipase C
MSITSLWIDGHLAHRPAWVLRSAALAALLLAIAPPAKSQTVPITHVIVIMQENRSFDNYFGTYPGANGIPPSTCQPLSPSKPSEGCVMPFHDKHDVNAGGPHNAATAQASLDDGITTAFMDGFVYQQAISLSHCGSEAQQRAWPEGGFTPGGNCKAFAAGVQRHDAMGYHTGAELPNYWAYAQHFVLQDALFEGVRAWSRASHLDLTSEWSAKCKDTAKVSTCVTDPSATNPRTGEGVKFPWVSLFQLMDVHGISWKYYLGNGQEPDCDDDEMTCEPQIQANKVQSLFNPTPAYAWVNAQGPNYLALHNPSLDQFLIDLQGGTLPQVSWIVPAGNFTEHPPNSITAGMEYVTSLVNAVMQSPYWSNTAIFIAWDDWGGFYDHVVPPVVDRNPTATPIQGFGLRVPGLLISAYARPGFIDHAVLSFDSYATLVEDLFMNSARLDPTALGQPDSRPTIRDAITMVSYPDGTTAPIGRLADEFDFTQAPLPPLVLSTHIPAEIQISCGATGPGNPQDCTKSSVKVVWHSVSGPRVPGPFTYQVLRDGVAIPACLTTDTSCVDEAPGGGVHYYTAYSIDTENVASPQSAAAEADVP